MTVNNSSNMNKANNHIVPQLIEHKKNTSYEFGISIPDSKQAHKFGGVKPVRIY